MTGMTALPASTLTMTSWETWLAVMMGGAIGALIRGAIILGFERGRPIVAHRGWRALGSARATLFVNVLGSLVLGWIVGGIAAHGIGMGDLADVFWLTGVCGALTTFSTLCADVVALDRRDRRVAGAMMLGAHIVFGLSAFSIGRALSSVTMG